jgi:hypothetical protein
MTPKSLVRPLIKKAGEGVVDGTKVGSEDYKALVKRSSTDTRADGETHGKDVSEGIFVDARINGETSHS